MERVPQREADLEPFHVGQVPRDGPEERRRDAHARKIERAQRDAPRRDAGEHVLGRGLAAAHEAERLHGTPREDGRGGGWVAAEGT